MDYSLSTILDRFENDKAVLITPYGQEIYWPRKAVPHHVEPGHTVTLALDDATGQEGRKLQKNQPKKSVTLDDLPKNERAALARAMLEELLNG